MLNILLLQSSVYFPSYGGGNKSNRLLLEALAQRGHRCWSISKSVDAQTVIDQRSEQHVLQNRGIHLAEHEKNVAQYYYNGVDVFSVNTNLHENLNEFIKQKYQSLAPDIIMVSDDKNGDLLGLALKLSDTKTVLIVHTNLHLPFGDEATKLAPERIEDYTSCKNILTSTLHTQRYLQKVAAIKSHYLPFPVYGNGPFKQLAKFGHGAIGMINPCGIKGISIFIELAKHFKHLPFIAVPTWGASHDDMLILKNLNNVEVLEPQDDVENILKQLNLLLVPSLIPETFGYVTVEAMLRGIPVLASDLGGLRDAKLGTDYLLPVSPAVNNNGAHKFPPQDITPWVNAVQCLSTDHKVYRDCSEQSYAAAREYVTAIDPLQFETYFNKILSHG